MRLRLPLAALFSTAVLAAAAASGQSKPAAKTVAVYVGTYTKGTESKGIYHLTLDLASGRLTSAGEPAAAINPSFLAFHPSGRFLYAVTEVSDYEQGAGAVSAFAIDAKSGALTPLNQQSSKGSGPCHLSLDKDGRHVLVANYGGGSVAVLPVEKDGRLKPASTFLQHIGSSVNPKRQSGPHAHSINLDPANHFAFVADLGLDKVFVYRFDAGRGELLPHDPPSFNAAPGAGPRHLAVSRDGKHVYVINEMAMTVAVLRYDGSAGELSEVQTISTLPEGASGSDYSTAEVVLSPDGKFLYGSNRGHDSLAIFAVDQASGRLARVGQQSTLGKTPRNFAIDPTGQYLLAANQNSDTVVVFKIDRATGKLTPVGEPFSVPRPVCVRMRLAGS
jgi:6-phosphogluconolactonase